MSALRNFSIIAHIDHGKSTLADRIIQLCGGLSEREMSEQVLDTLEIERERGITIKSQSVSLKYKAGDGKEYRINLIDTPGHVDFSYEVSRSLVACEGAVLLVDATQGVEAQSVATCLAAMEHDLEIVPALNKIDLPSADPDRVTKEIQAVLGLETGEIPCISAKYGTGVRELLDLLIRRIPAPQGDARAPLRALVIDSWFDNYHGVVSLVRIVDGCLETGASLRVMSTGQSCRALETGVFTPKRLPCPRLEAGETGYLVAGIKELDWVPVGDTITLQQATAARPLAGFRRIEPRVFAGVFSADAARYGMLREALYKLRLNDTALHFEPETSQALGQGFRCGFLGLLHFEITLQRLEREYGLEWIVTAPSVAYQAVTDAGKSIMVDNPSLLPDPSRIREIREPIMQADIIAPREYIGAIISLCIQRRGRQKSIQYLGRQVSMRFELPLGEIIWDFFDQLKSVSHGYASFDYTELRFNAADLVKLDLLVNGERIDALSVITHRNDAERRGRDLVRRLRAAIPRQMFDIAVQAAIGSRIMARETVKGLRKNVTAKCYGGDVTRKRKLLDKQKEGKKRMKRFGSVFVPQEALTSLLSTRKTSQWQLSNSR